MKSKKPARAWSLSPEDLPSEESVRRADYLIGLADNAVFRLLTYRATPFWRRGEFILGVIIAIAALAVGGVYGFVFGMIFACSSGMIFYLVRVLMPDDFVLDELTLADLENLISTQVGVRDLALGIWGVRTSRRWIASRVKAGRIAFWVGWALVILPVVPKFLVGFMAGWNPLPGDLGANIFGMLLIASGASIQRRMLASPAHALPECLRILDNQIKRIETRDQPVLFHMGQMFNLMLGSIAKFFILVFWFIFLIFMAVVAGLLIQAAATRGINLYFSPDLQGLILGMIAWGVGRVEGQWWREYAEPDMRRNYMELMEKVQFIVRREQRHITQGELAQRFPRPEHLT